MIETLILVGGIWVMEKPPVDAAHPSETPPTITRPSPPNAVAKPATPPPKPTPIPKGYAPPSQGQYGFEYPYQTGHALEVRTIRL
jgi:hypothetical protein